MKVFLISLLFFCTTLCNAQINNVGDYTIGKTSLDDFYRISKFESTRSNIITSESDYESIWVKLYFDTTYTETKVYEINFDKRNLEDFGWKLTSPTNQRTKVFYITQLQQPGYVANNILLTFYKGILTKIEYDFPANLFASFVDKYQKAGDSSTETKTISQCKQATSQNISKTVNIYDRINNSHSTLEYIEGTDAACKPYAHFDIKIFNQNLWQEYLTDAKNSLPVTQKKASDEYVNELMKQLKEKQKKSRRRKNLSSE